MTLGTSVIQAAVLLDPLDRLWVRARTRLDLDVVARRKPPQRERDDRDDEQDQRNEKQSSQDVAGEALHAIRPSSALDADVAHSGDDERRVDEVLHVGLDQDAVLPWNSGIHGESSMISCSASW